MREWITGRNPVYEVLRARRRQPFQLRLAPGIQEKGRIEEIKRLCRERKIPVETVPRSSLDAFGEGHQGVAIETSGYPYSSLADILTLAGRLEEPAWILILDLIQDPQNLGTLLRTAEIVGVHGILLPLRQTATVTPAVVNASSGASEHLFIAQANLSQAISQLKEKGLWIVGLEGVDAAAHDQAEAGHGEDGDEEEGRPRVLFLDRVAEAGHGPAQDHGEKAFDFHHSAS